MAISSLRHLHRVPACCLLSAALLASPCAWSQTAAETAPASGNHAATGGRTNSLGDPKSRRAGSIRNEAATGSHQEADRQTNMQVSAADRKLMRELAQAHMAEIKMAGLATAISSNEAVYGYAQKMLEEHSRALDELKLLAADAKVVLPGGVESEEAAALHALALMTGEEFDAAYLNQAGHALHEKARRLFEQAASSANAPALKEYAATMLASVDGHLQLARRMQDDPKNAAVIVRSSIMAGRSGGIQSGARGNAVIAGAASAHNK